jgi:hypothetical protein
MLYLARAVDQTGASAIGTMFLTDTEAFTIGGNRIKVQLPWFEASNEGCDLAAKRVP